ncbi:MAG: class I SAM-dependent methyltransferase [Candidatus Binatia bacterium]
MTPFAVSAPPSRDRESAQRTPTDTQAALQERQYLFPYHYLPVYDGKRFSQVQHWSWGYRYLGRLQIALDLLARIPFQSLLDVGCGDGRLLGAVRERWPASTVLGIDTSDAAIAMARRMNPEIPVEVRDLLRAPLDGCFDVVTALDVMEHVRPEVLPAFLHTVAVSLRPGGTLVLTVPHTNQALIDKHYQHFNSVTLRRLLEGGFSEPRFLPFDRRSWVFDLLWKALGGSGRYYVVTHAGINTLLFRHYQRRQLYAGDERTCLRIACVARKAPAAGPAGG